jgi:hypothetical protein
LKKRPNVRAKETYKRDLRTQPTCFSPLSQEEEEERERKREREREREVY